MADSEWLNSLKAGDVVVVRRGYVYYGLTLDVVERTTPTQIIVRGERGLRFRRSDGGLVGGDNKRLIQPTQAVRDEIRRVELVEMLGTESLWRAVPLETLEAIVALLTPQPASED